MKIMVEILKTLTTIKDALGGDDQCQVMACTNTHGGVTLRIQWKDDHYDRLYTLEELENTENNDSLICRFIGWAQERKTAWDKQQNEKTPLIDQHREDQANEIMEQNGIK